MSHPQESPIAAQGNQANSIPLDSVLENSLPDIGEPAEPLNDVIEYSLFENAYDNKPKPQQLSWQELQALFATHNHHRKDKCPRVSFTTYKPGTTRAKSNVTSTTAIILDFDENAPDKKVMRLKLRGIRYLAYSTTRHTPEEPRYRIILPLSKPVPPAKHKSTFDKVNWYFTDSIAEASFGTDNSHMANLPNCPIENIGNAWTWAQDGELLNPDDLPEPPKEQSEPISLPPVQNGAQSQHSSKERYLETVISNECATITAAHNGTRNRAANRVAFKLGQFIGGGDLSRQEAENRLTAAAQLAGLTGKEIPTTIASGINAGMQAPRTVPEPRIATTSNNTLAVPEKSTFETFTFSDLAKLPRTKWLIRGIIPEGTVGIISGDTGSFKSFIATEMGECIALGMPWHGRETKAGNVLYAAPEGFYTIHDRMRAWALHHDIKPPENMRFHKYALNLAEPAITSGLIDAVKDMQPAFIVLDTLSQCAAGLNENDNGAMALFMRGMMRLAEKTGASVMILHHNSKATGQYRGASSIKANADYHLSLDRPENDDTNTVYFRCEKQRGKPFDDFTLKGEVVELPECDEYGEPITSLVFEAIDEPAPIKSKQHPNQQRANKTRDRLLELFDQVALDAEKFGGGVKVGFWKEAVEQEKACAERTFWRYKTAMEKDGTIIENGTHNGSPLFYRGDK